MPQFSVPLSKVIEKMKLEVVYAPRDVKDIPIILSLIHI